MALGLALACSMQAALLAQWAVTAGGAAASGFHAWGGRAARAVEATLGREDEPLTDTMNQPDAARAWAAPESCASISLRGVSLPHGIGRHSRLKNINLEVPPAPGPPPRGWPRPPCLDAAASATLPERSGAS